MAWQGMKIRGSNRRIHHQRRQPYVKRTCPSIYSLLSKVNCQENQHAPLRMLRSLAQSLGVQVRAGFVENRLARKYLLVGFKRAERILVHFGPVINPDHSVPPISIAACFSWWVL